MKLNRRLTIIISVLGGLSALIFGGLAVPTVMAIRSLRTQIADEYLNIERKYVLRRHTRSSLDTLENLDPKIEKLSGMVITEGNELDFISALERTATLSGINQDLTLETVNQKDISPWERDIPIRIRLVGDYQATVSYLERLHALPYYIAINSLDINTSSLQKKVQYGAIQIQTEIKGNVRWFSRTHPVLSRINPDDYDDFMKSETDTADVDSQQ